MRILVAAQCFDPAAGGSERQTCQQAGDTGMSDLLGEVSHPDSTKTFGRRASAAAMARLLEDACASS